MNDLKTALQEESYKTLVDAYKHMGCDADTKKTVAIGYWRVVEAFIDCGFKSQFNCSCSSDA